jgi:hypothetical protein
VPFTPFHLGPGTVVKAVAGDSFSLMVFGCAQIAMDVEPLLRLLRGDRYLHGFSHTFLGGTLIAIATVLVGRPIGQRFLNLWEPPPEERFLKWLRGPRMMSWTAALSGASVSEPDQVGRAVLVRVAEDERRSRWQSRAAAVQSKFGPYPNIERSSS